MSVLELHRSVKYTLVVTRNAKGPIVDTPSVLCPVDFSPASLAAVTLAVEEAKRRDGVVDLVHVWEPGAGYVGEFAPIPIEPSIPIEAIHADLSTIAVDLPEDRVRRHVESGDPADEIIAAAKKLESAVVVMGTHARRGFARWIIGSVCDHVLQHAPCPVLICRGPEKAE